MSGLYDTVLRPVGPEIGGEGWKLAPLTKCSLKLVVMVDGDNRGSVQ